MRPVPAQTFCNVEMVPPPNSVRDSRHVAIRGLPPSTSEESLRDFLGRFGRLHGAISRVESQGQEIIYASFVDNRSAAIACTAERFDKNSACRITLCNPDDRKRPPDPSNFVAYIVVFDIPVGPSEKDVFEAVKAHSKRHGLPTHIYIDASGVDYGWWKARVSFVKLNTEELKADHSLILGNPPQFRISRLKEPPNSHPPCTPSTSNPPVREVSTSTSVHVPNPDNHNRAYFERRFQKYGHVLEVLLLATRDRQPFAIVQFGCFEHARRALRDTDYPKPMDGPSRKAKKIVVFGLPEGDPFRSEEMTRNMVFQRLTVNLDDVKLDLNRKLAILNFDNLELATQCYDKLQAGAGAVNNYRPDFDYCSDYLNSYLFPNEPTTPFVRKMSNLSSESDRRHRERTRSGTSPSVLSPRRSRTSEPQASTSRAEESDPDDSNGDGLERSSEDDNHAGHSHQNGVHDAPRIHQLLSDESPDYSSSPFAHQGTSYDQSESAEASTQEQDQEDDDSDNSSSRSHRRREDRKSSGSASSAKSSNSEPPDKAENEPLPNKKRRRRKKEGDSDHSDSPEPQPWIDPKTKMSTMLEKLRWKSLDLSRYPKRIDEVLRRNMIAREIYEKTTGRPFPKFNRENELKLENHLQYDRADHSTDPASSETEIRQREWTRYYEAAEDLEEFRSLDTASLLRNPDPATPMVPMSRGSGRPSIEEVRSTRLSLDLAHHPHELAQRSHSLCIGPMTPLTPFHSVPPLLVNTSTPGPSQPGPSGVMTPRGAQAQAPSPISRHGSVSSSSGRPASIQTLRHQSVMFPPDITIPPPPVPPTHDEMMSAPPTRRSSETLASTPMWSPSLSKQIPPLLPLAHPPNVITGTPTGTHSVSSSATSTPRHSISGTPVHHEVITPKIQQPPQTPKTRPPEKVQVRHDSISKPGPSSAASALQARSQSISVPEPKKVDRAHDSEQLYNNIMANKPNQAIKNMPRIEKKSSALLNNAQNQQNVPSIPSGSVNTPALSINLKDKEKEKEKRRKERELEREREARKEMKRNETKEDRQKRKEKERAERAKKEEEERRERKREKQLKKEKERQREEKERREREEKEKQKEKEKKRAEKRRSKKKRRKDSDSDSSESDSDEEEVKKPKTQEEKDHELALLLARGGIAEGLKSRRSGVKYGSEPEKSKNRQRRVLIDSSDDSGDDNDKKASSNDENSDTEQRHLPPPPVPPSIPVQPTKDQKQKVRKEREKGELTSSSEEEDDREEEERREKEQQKIREREDRENRKRQKSLTNYSSDDHNDGGKTMKKKKKRDDSEERMRKKKWELKDQKQRKRKLEHRRSSENESKRKAKPDDFRDVPLEDVSDEEEVEESSRVRRPSTSSIASTNEKKSAKTPLRVTTPSVTPLQTPKILSPKILSPKILSPKTSSSSTKRPSISDQESLASLTSPKPRNRTTSSTSTATTASRPEVPIPEKVLSPPVTAKSSVSSIDDLAIREDLSATSAAASPMSTTGRPIILTKAAMKAFNSPPKQRQHETSSESSASSDESDDSTDETIVSTDRPVDAAEGAADSVDRDQSLLLIPPPPVPPLIPPPPPPPVLEVPAPTDNVGSVPSPQTPLPASVEPLEDSSPSPKEPEQDLQQSFSPEHAEDLGQFQDTSDQDETMVQDSGDMDDTLFEEKGVSEKTDPIPTEQPAEEVPIKEANHVEEEEEEVATASDDFMSPGPQDVERSETASAQPQSLISDQETDQAVQSIFNEEDEEDFPQYPDFVMPKESRDEKESPPRFDDYRIALEPNRKTMEPLELDKAVASIVEQNKSPTSENHNDCRSDTSNYFNEQKRQELLRSMKGSENRTPRSDENEVVETDREVPMEEMDTQEVFDSSEAKKKGNGEKQSNASTLFAQHSHLSHPEQTPTPELIPNEVIHEDGRAGNDDLRVQTQRQFQQNHSQAIQSPKFYTEQLLQSPSQGNSAGSNVSAGRPVPVQHPESVDASQYNQNSCLHSNLSEPSREELNAMFQREAEESSRLQRKHASEVELQKKLEDSQRERTMSDLENLMNGKKAAVGGFMHYLNPAAQTIFSSLNIDPFRARIAKEPSLSAKEPLSTSSASEQIDGVFIRRWFYKREKYASGGRSGPPVFFFFFVSSDIIPAIPSLHRVSIPTCEMSAEEPSSTIATAPTSAATSSADLATMLQQIQALQAAQQQQAPVVTTASAPSFVNSLESILGQASLASLATAGAAAINPLSLLALSSTLSPQGPMYQGLARALMTLNMGQLIANHQTSELLASMGQQDALMALLAGRGGNPFQLPGQQQQLQQQGVFAVPQVPQIPHMSLKRNNKEQLTVGGSDRKKSCPPLAMISGGHQGQPPSQPVAAPPPVAPQSPSPPPKSMFENLPPEMKEKNEMFRKEILRRLDIILLEELGTEDEEEDKKPDPKQILTSDEDDTDDSKTESMGAAGSAFRRILSRSSTMGNNSGSPSASGTTSPSTGSLSSGPDSPSLEKDPLSTDFLDMLTTIAQKHKLSSKFDGLTLATCDETSFQQKFPIMWSGRLALKSMETSINLHYLTGREQFLKEVLGSDSTDDKPRRESVRITQRLRLDNGQLQHIHDILNNPDFACCIGLTATPGVDSLANGESVQSSIIEYLNKKQYAGISCLNNRDALSTARVHVFAPGPLVTQYLSELCPKLLDYVLKTNVNFLLIVFTNDKPEPSVMPPCTPSDQIVVE